MSSSYEHLHSLTTTEVHVLTAIAEGVTNNKALAELFAVSEATIHGHLLAIYSKLGVSYTDESPHKKVLAVTRAYELHILRTPTELFCPPPVEIKKLPLLTAQQLRIIALLWDGVTTNRALAERLVVSTATIKNHLALIYDRLDISPDQGDDNKKILTVKKCLELGVIAIDS